MCTTHSNVTQHIICFDLYMYFLIDSNMSTTVVMINKLIHLVKFYFFAVIKLKYHNSLKSYIHLKLTAFECLGTDCFKVSVTNSIQMICLMDNISENILSKFGE